MAVGAIFPYGRALALAPFHGQPLVAYLALCRLVPPTGASGGSLSEPPAAYGYSRVRYDFSAANWEPVAVDTLTNTTAVAFPTVTVEPWGWVSGWAVVTAPTGGDIVVGGRLLSGRTFDVGQTAVFQPSSLRFGIRG